VAARPGTQAIDALASAPPRWNLAATGALLTAGTGVALYATLGWVYSSLMVSFFGGQLVAGRQSILSSAGAVATTVLACAVTGAYCAARPGPGALLFALQLAFVVIPLQALTSVGALYAQPAFSAGVGLAFTLAVAVAACIPRLRAAPPPRTVALMIVVLLVLAGLYLYGVLIAGGGLQRFNFDLSKAYDIRAEFLEQSQLPMVGYLVPWFGYVLNPALCLVGLRRRAWLWVIVSLALQALLFGATGYRSFLFLPLLIAGCAWLGARRHLPTLLILAVGLVIAIALALYAITDVAFIPALLVERLVMVPAEVHFWYYDYFATQGHDLLMLSQSVLSPFANAPSQPIADTIGRLYLGGLASANVGLFGDAYANFGFIGCAVYGVLTALLVSAVDGLGRNFPRWFAAGLVGAAALQLVNAGLLTTMATHGFALLLVVLWLLQPQPRRAPVGAPGG
jgi:hypothetical protein